MSSEILVAIITAGISLIGTIVTVVMTNRSTLSALSEQSKIADEKIQGQINVLQTEIQTLSQRVEKHNQMVERTYNLESRVAVLEAKGQGQRASVVQ